MSDEKKQIVKDRFGKVLGTVEEPEPEPGPSAAERITQGFEQKRIDAQLGMISFIDGPMTRDAQEAQKLLDKVSQWSLKERVEAKRKRAELFAKFEAAQAPGGELFELRKDAMTGKTDQYQPFSKTVDEHLKHLKRHFTEEAPFDLHRK